MDEILKRQEYCGDVLNFKTHSKSFKNHRRIDNPKEEWLVFEDKHEAIIDRSTYNKVQKMLGKTKHRAPKEENGPKSIFSDLLRCADCGSKLWYHTNTQNKDIHYFSCSNYVKDYRGSYLDVSCDTKKPSFVEDIDALCHIVLTGMYPVAFGILPVELGVATFGRNKEGLYIPFKSFFTFIHQDTSFFPVTYS